MVFCISWISFQQYVCVAFFKICHYYFSGIAAALKKAMKAGCLDRFAFAKAALMQKALLAAGASPQSVAKAFKLQVKSSYSIMVVYSYGDHP